MLVVLVLMLGIAHLVRYPDVVEARAMLTTQKPPIRLAAKANGKIAQLMVTNGQAVQPGQLVAVLENPARLKDVALLDSVLQKMLVDETVAYLELRLPSVMQLGPLQASFANFAQRHQELLYFLSQEINFQKITNFQRQIEEMRLLNKSLFRQANILQEEVALAHQNVLRDSQLLTSNAISKLEFEKSQSQWLTKRRELEALRSGTSQNNLRVQQMQAQILDLQQAQSDGKSQKLLDFQADVEKLVGEITIWKQTYLMEAPVGGEIALTKAWSEQMQVEEGTEVLTIVPKDGAGSMVAKAVLTGNRSGKVKDQMPVNIRLDGYPYQEFGVLNGTVQRIAPVPSEEGYEVEIALPAELVTSFGKPIPFRQEMQGTARIITEKRSLLQRVLDKVWAALMGD
jgi:HlyD family secretion protein